MRKSILVFGAAFSLLFIAMMFMGVVNAYERDRSDDEVSFNFSNHGMMGYGYNLNSYERIYIHLSESNRDKLDMAFVNELIVSDIQLKEAEAVVEMINQIKIDILEEVEFEYSTQRHGMMRGNMMGYNTNEQDTSCGFEDRINTYEWFYVHSSEAQRQSLDVAFAEAIMQIDLTHITDLELAEIIEEIKLVLVNQIIDQNQLNE